MKFDTIAVSCFRIDIAGNVDLTSLLKTVCLTSSSSISIGWESVMIDGGS